MMILPTLEFWTAGSAPGFSQDMIKIGVRMTRSWQMSVYTMSLPAMDRLCL